MTILHVSALAAFCLMLAALCRWISRRPTEAAPPEERFHRLFEYAAVAMSIVDSDKRFVHVNRAYSELLGYDTTELLGRPFTMVAHPEDIPEHLVLWDEVFRRTECSSAQDKRYIRKDGRVIWVRVTANLFKPSDGTAPLVMAVVENITERKQAEQVLRQSEARLIEAIPQQVWTARPDGTLDYVNRRVLEYFDVPAERLLDWGWQSVLHPDDLPACMTAWTASLQTGEPYEIEFRLRQAGAGTYRWHLTRALPMRDETGRIVKWIGTNTDITGRRQVEEALRESEERFRVLADTAPVLIWMSGRDNRISYFNTRWLEYTGRTMEQELGDGWIEGVHSDDVDRCWNIYSEAFDRREPFDLEYRLRKADGQYGWLHESGAPRFLPGGTFAGYHGACIDITARKLAEAELRRVHDELERRVSERTAQLAMANRSLQDEIAERKHVEEAVRDSELRYKLLTEATFDGIAIHDQGILIEVNAGLGRIFGYGPGELIGRSLWDLVADESRDLVLANMQNGVNGPYEAMGRRKDGTTFPGEVVVRPCRYRGKEVRLVAGRDITERKHLEAERSRHTEELEHQIAERTAEIAKLESQRAQTEKLAAMGRLAAGVAHEINNPIAGIKNAFTLVKQAVDPAHPHAEFVGMIDREITRVASIVQNMYQLYRPESGKGEAVELRSMMNDIEALFSKRLQQRRLELAIDVDSCIERLRVPRGDLLQVLLNLLNNAIDCSSDGGTVTLAICVEPDAIRIAVSDQGPGISPDNLPHIFDPFFTTKTERDQKGMGLGLSISQSLVMAMGGKIEVRTQPNGGSTFSVLLPRHTAGACAQGQSNIIKEVVTHVD
ncbi:MAG TPA: PAS domain S-box protein [Nitrospira sp.]|nr:PAS domain S-box protein [Nitrospira sp.]